MTTPQIFMEGKLIFRGSRKGCFEKGKILNGEGGLSSKMTF